MIKSKPSTFLLFHYSFDNMAGTERVLANLVETLSKIPGARIHLVLAAEKKEMAIDLSAFPVEVHYLSATIREGGTLHLSRTHLNIYRETRAFIRRQRFEGKVTFLATHVLLASVLYLATPVKKRRTIRFISCEHFSISVTGRFSQWLRKRVYPRMTVITLTERDKDLIAKQFKPKEVYCIPNASPFAIDGSGFSPHHKTILAVGRFARQKGFDLLVKAYGKIHAEFPDWQLNIYGHDYGEKVLVQKLIKEQNIRTIHLFDVTRNIQEIYRRASFFVLSSRFEGLPMVLIEAISFGLPIIAFDCPTGPAEIVNEMNGALVENGNVVALAKTMKEFMRNTDLLNEKSEGALKKAHEYSKEKIDRLWLEVL